MTEKINFTPMEYDDLKKAMDGLFAFDSGCVDSGIHDNELKARVNATLDAMSHDEQRKTLSRMMYDLYLCDAALANGYGWEDALSFGGWLEGDLRW